MIFLLITHFGLKLADFLALGFQDLSEFVYFDHSRAMNLSQFTISFLFILADALV